LRIALLCPLWERVPPPAYGGIEAVVSLLAEGLVERGHQVTLYASGDSITSAELRAVYPRSLRTDPGVVNPHYYDWSSVFLCAREAHRFDVIHNHAGELPMLLAEFLPTPMLTTSHGPCIPDTDLIWGSYKGYYNTISRAAKTGLPDRGYLGVVYNAVDVASFPYSEDKDDYLLFLSRISPEKGTHHAIEVARRLRRRLIIAGKVDRVDREYFAEQVEPKIDGQLVQFVGEADAQQKRELFVRASCLLHPVTWPEPFGLVMAEAMACGTPVVAFSQGSVPELVVHGETGYVVRDVDEMADAVGLLDRIDRRRCREHVARNFDVPQMIDGYVALYERIITGEAKASLVDRLEEPLSA